VKALSGHCGRHRGCALQKEQVDFFNEKLAQRIFARPTPTEEQSVCSTQMAMLVHGKE